MSAFGGKADIGAPQRLGDQAVAKRQLQFQDLRFEDAIRRASMGKDDVSEIGNCRQRTRRAIRNRARIVPAHFWHKAGFQLCALVSVRSSGNGRQGQGRVWALGGFDAIPRARARHAEQCVPRILVPLGVSAFAP